ncbi:MAG: HU family DNA-binding protein [Thermodesulfobacteriota bacterium]
MLKKNLIDQIHARTGSFYKHEIEAALDIILESITEAMAENNRVELRGFGSFSVRTRNGYCYKHPQSGEIMKVVGRKKIHFTMGKSLKQSLIGLNTGRQI